MRPTESRVVVEELNGRRDVYVVTEFTDKTPPERFGQVMVSVRESAVMLTRNSYEQFFLTTESIPVLVEAIEKAKELGK